MPMRLSLSPQLQAKLGLKKNASAAEVMSALDTAIGGRPPAAAPAAAAAPRAPKARPLQLLTASDLSEAQVHDMVFGSGAIPPGLTPVVEPHAPTNDGSTEDEAVAFVLGYTGR